MWKLKKICTPRKRYIIDMQRASIILTRYYPTWGDTNGCRGKKQPELTNTMEEGRDYEEQHNFTRNPFQWYHFKCLCPPSHYSGQTGGAGRKQFPTHSTGLKARCWCPLSSYKIWRWKREPLKSPFVLHPNECW